MRLLSVTFRDNEEWRVIDLAPDGVPDVPAITQSRVHRFYASPGPHKHVDCFELGMCLRGSLTLLNNNIEHRVLPGNLFLNKPNDLHCLSDCPPGTRIYSLLFHAPARNAPLLRFTPAETKSLISTLQALPSHIVANATDVQESFRELFRQYDNSRPPFRPFCLSTACAEVIMAFINASEPQQKSLVRTARIEKIRDEMQAHPEKTYNLYELARLAGLSPAAFIAQFKLLTGQPPYHYLLNCRLEEAKRRLAETNHTVTRIAMDLGFCAPQHFSFHFKKAFGTSPKEWRRANAALTGGGSCRVRRDSPSLKLRRTSVSAR